MPCLICKKMFFTFSSPKRMLLKNNYISKDATQQDIFLKKYPTFDGRGIKIAIIDSGFDVSLDGFQQTSEGLPKIIDCFDFTGNGDVDTSEIRKAEKNILIGLSGRKLKIPKKWFNPSEKWHLGLKSLYKPTMSKKISDICEKLPEIDCIVWFDGRKWCACIETNGTNLEKAKVLTNFRDEHKYGILSLDGLKMTYCITIHNNGNLLEICMPYEHHGSVVAQNAAAHCPKNRKMDGLAPGAQMIFMCVMDPHNDHILNMKALKKSLLKCIEMKVDIINYSIASFAGDEEIMRIIREMEIVVLYASVYKCDKDIEDVTFKIGAALTPKMKKQLYNIHTDVSCPPVVYPFSSRGPGASTNRGLDFVAPGATIANIPRFASEKNAGCSGTSYSSPNAAGAVACLLSGFKAKKLKYSPKLIEFVLAETAYLPENGNKFEFGHGIIQIYDAFEYIKMAKIDTTKIQTPLIAAGGTFLMQYDDEETILKYNVDLFEFLEIQYGEGLAKKWTLVVSPKSAENFVELLSKINENNIFKIKINTKNLEPGSLNNAEILVIDPFIGEIYSIPITVLYILKITETRNYRFKKEITLNYENPYHLTFMPIIDGKNTNNRFDLKITALKPLATTKLFLQYHFHEKTFEEAKNSIKIIQFSPKNQIQILSFPFENKKLQQICIHQEIGGLSNAKFKLEFNFEWNEFTRL